MSVIKTPFFFNFTKTNYMRTNMGLTDRVVRVLISFTLIFFLSADLITGAFAILSLTVAGVFLITSLLGFCPLYKILGISTFTKHTKQS